MASTRSDSAGAMRLGRSGMPNIWFGSKTARSYRHERSVTRRNPKGGAARLDTAKTQSIMPLTIPILYGSLRRDRVGIRVVRFLSAALRRRGHDVMVVDAAEKQLPLLDRMYKEYSAGAAPPVLEELAQLYRRADGFVVVAGEYNHGIQPGLSNLLDHFLEEYFFRPSAIACYSAGAFGGVRAAMALRMTLAELGMPSIPSLLPVPRVQEAFDLDGVPHEPAWEQRSDRFLAEFEWYARALKAERRRGVPY